MNDFMQRMNAPLGELTPARLLGIRRGIEKESLRVQPNGMLALTPHPLALGSALTHPHITTDFSESQLEFVTGVHTSAQACLDELTSVHQFSYRALRVTNPSLATGTTTMDIVVDDSLPQPVIDSPTSALTWRSGLPVARAARTSGAKARAASASMRALRAIPA